MKTRLFLGICPYAAWDRNDGPGKDLSPIHADSRLQYLCDRCRRSEHCYLPGERWNRETGRPYNGDVPKPYRQRWHV